MAVVAILCSHLVDDNVHRSWIRSKYVAALEKHSGVGTVLLPTFSSRASTVRALARVDGILLTGDESNIDKDVLQLTSPARSQDMLDWKNCELDHHRDTLALHAINYALERELPILGICRGLQELNVLLGGSLHQELSHDERYGDTHHEDLALERDEQYQPVHSVSIQPKGVLSTLVPPTPDANTAPQLQVNSLHHQAIDHLADALQTEAIASDGIIEAASIRNARTFQVGVQWHPEWHADTDPFSQKLFAAFGKACTNYETHNAPRSRERDSGGIIRRAMDARLRNKPIQPIDETESELPSHGEPVVEPV